MVLTDVLYAINCGLAPNFSTSELFIRLPTANHQFRTVYNALTHGFALPQDVRSEADGLLLLTALLNDIVYLHRCHLSLTYSLSTQPDLAPGLSNRTEDGVRNPYASLSSKSEFARLSAELMAALSDWEKHFQGRVDSNMLALYYFCRLQMTCPEIWELPRLVGCGSTTGFQTTHLPPKSFDIPDNAMDLAWLVLDHCGKSSKTARPQLSIWFPIVLFMSALVVWQRLRSQVNTDMSYGTLRVLNAFRVEIARLPWPCCVDMVKTLDSLMES